MGALQERITSTKKGSITSVQANASEYFDNRFFSVFCDAYAGLNDAYWLRDAALICLKDGDYDTAYSIKPDIECSFILSGKV